MCVCVAASECLGIAPASPYYGLRNYGEAGQIGLEETPEEYTWRLVEVFREVRRVLKDDGLQPYVIRFMVSSCSLRACSRSASSW